MKGIGTVTALAIGLGAIASTAGATEKINLGELNWPGLKGHRQHPEDCDRG